MMSAQLQRPSDSATSTPASSDRPSALGAADATGSHDSSNGASSSLPPLVNRVAQGFSPYVRARSNSPVAWQLLDSEAVNRARSENKLIFLSIGFLASHRK